jgi:hypothetical protein
MRVLTTILGLVCGLMLAILTCNPVYDLIWPRATDKNQGGLGLFLVLVLAPAFMIVGSTVGAIVGRGSSKDR